MTKKSVFLCRCIVALILLCAWGIVEAGLKAGAAKKSIVPPFPTNMGGFTDRTKNFEGVHDELFARAVILDNGTTKVAFVGSDLMAIDAEMVRLIREQVQQSIGLSATNLMICCTHNHSAPSYYQKTQTDQDDEKPSLKQFLIKQFSEAVIEADRGMVNVQAGFAAGSLTGVTRNRQQKNDLIDPQVGVLRVEELATRKTVATLFNFTGHPVIIGSTNLLLSGEYPGAASRAVENLLGGVAIFTQGACGDITVNRSGDPFLEIERFGRVVAGEVIKVSGLVKFDEQTVLRAASTTLTLPARSVPSVEEAKATFERGKAAFEQYKQKNASPVSLALLEDKNRVYALDVKRAEGAVENPKRRETELKAEVQVIQVGTATFGAIPGEIFVEYALELRSRVKQDAGMSFCLVGYANGYLGYIVTPRAVETGGYEASVTRLTGQAGRFLTEAMMELVHQINRN